MSGGDLVGRVALVTGSTAGIGRAAAEALASCGASIVAHGIEPGHAEAVAADWSGRGWQAASSDADLGTPDGPARLVADVTHALGTIDILVLNASLELPQQLADITTEALARQTAVNLVASTQLLQACLPSMRRRGWGRVVAIGSVQEERPNARHLFYAGTKAALTCMILNLARHEAAVNVTFNVLRPGAIRTDRNRATLADPAYLGAVLDRIPLGRIGEPDDCGPLIAMLCSEKGSYVNGAILAVDGGMRL